jgi:hypothetical protein
MKWCLVAAGIKDLARPPEKLSVSQNIGAIHFETRRAGVNVLLTALAATGFIWVRYSLVITPVNYSLAAVRTEMYPQYLRLIRFRQVNFFVGASGLTQLTRIAM